MLTVAPQEQDSFTTEYMAEKLITAATSLKIVLVRSNSKHEGNLLERTMCLSVHDEYTVNCELRNFPSTSLVKVEAGIIGSVDSDQESLEFAAKEFMSQAWDSSSQQANVSSSQLILQRDPLFSASSVVSTRYDSFQKTIFSEHSLRFGSLIHLPSLVQIKVKIFDGQEMLAEFRSKRIELLSGFLAYGYESPNERKRMRQVLEDQILNEIANEPAKRRKQDAAALGVAASSVSSALVVQFDNDDDDDDGNQEDLVAQNYDDDEDLLAQVLNANRLAGETLPSERDVRRYLEAVQGYDRVELLVRKVNAVKEEEKKKD